MYVCTVLLVELINGVTVNECFFRKVALVNFRSVLVDSSIMVSVGCQMAVSKVGV